MGRWTARAQWVFAGILPIFLVLAVLRLAHYGSDRQHVLLDQGDRFRAEYATILQCLEAQARFIHNESLNRPEVLAEVRSAWRAPDEAGRAPHRDRLQALMEPTWANLQTAGFRQFHFHFPDCTSFLRMHRPERFGDSLADIRETVVVANRDLVPVVGFEEGRIFNAYRNVFPLIYEGEHVGSVEVSFSLAGIRETLKDQIGGRHQLIMDREVVSRKLFTEERANYADWPWNEDYLLDVAASRLSLFEDLGARPQPARLRRQIAAGLATGRDFSLPLRLAGRSYILQLTAIKSFGGQQVAYWVFLHESPPLEDLRLHLLFVTSLFLLAVLLSLAALLWMRRLQGKLKEAESFLPVCATCKKVRPVPGAPDDPRSWISLEEYLARRTDERISHGICPDCLQKVIQENDL